MPRAPHPPHPTCLCACCLVRRTEEALDYQLDEVLVAAWSLAESDHALWRERVWPLIDRVESAHQNGEIDGHAEDELRELVRPYLLARDGLCPLK